MKSVAICLLWATSALAQSALTDWIPPQNRVIIGINLRAIIDSAALTDLTTGNNSLGAMLLAQNGVKGLNPLTDVDSVLITTTGEGTTPPTLTILRGRFNAKMLSGAVQYHGVALVDSKDSKSLMAVLDGSTMIAGDPAQVHTAIDGRGAAHAIDPALAARIGSLSARFDVWGLGDNLKGIPAASGQPGGLEAMDRFQFGAIFRKDLTMEAEAHVRTAQDAKKMSDSLQFFQAMLNGQKTQATGSKFSLESSNGTFKLAVTIPEAELKKAIAAQKTSMAAAFAPKPKPTRPEDVKIINKPNGDTLMVILPGGGH